MFWHRSTKDIVISRKRKREEQAQRAASQPASAQDAQTAATSDEPDKNNLENRMEETSLDKAASFKLDPRQQRIIIGIAAAAGLLLLFFLLLPKRDPGKNRLDVADGMSIVALQDTALAGSITTGDIVQLYAPDGTVIPQLRYVQVCGVDENGLLLAMEPVQVTAFVQHDAVTAALITQSDTRAEELLEVQRSILHPKITLQLSKHITLKPGETWVPDLVLTMEPVEGIIPDIIWSSSDQEICSVSEGLLNAGAIGKAAVTVSCGEASASCTVEVRVPLVSLQLNTGEASLAVGETVQLSAAPEPQDATGFKATWTSDNPAVATVTADGLVTAVSSGTATITASCDDISASCTVKVGVHTELIQLSQREVTLAPEETLVLQYAISPAENNLDSVRFSSSDPETVSVASDGKITALKAGTVTITVTAGDASDSCTVTVAETGTGTD